MSTNELREGESLMATEDNSWQVLSPKELTNPPKHLLGVRGYNKMTEEYEPKAPYKLSKITLEHQRGKTAWDWLQLLIIPLVLGAGAIWFNMQQSQTSLQIAQANRNKDLQVAKDTQEEATLKAFLDDMSDLLLNHNLRKSHLGDEASQLGRERTLTTLRRLKADRNRIVVQFLQDAHLIGGENAVINLSYPDQETGLHRQIMRIIEHIPDQGGASGRAYLPGGLSGDDLRLVNLNFVDLGGADLSFADLSGADLSFANLNYTKLNYTNLSGADLSNATLSGADLSNANLSGAVVTQEQLTRAYSLKGAIMPGGSIHP